MALPFFGLGTTPLLKPWEVVSKYLPTGTGGFGDAIQTGAHQVKNMVQNLGDNKATQAGEIRVTNTEIIQAPKDDPTIIDVNFVEVLKNPEPTKAKKLLHWSHPSNLNDLWKKNMAE
jgi:hypothetical protein